MNRFTTRPLIALLAALIAWPAIAARTETSSTLVSYSAAHLILNEDTSAVNTQLVLTIPARDFSRRLLAVQIVCSGSATITVTQKITRTITSGAIDMLLPDIPLSATTSGAMYSDIRLRDTDTLEVTVPAGGGGITCSASVVEEIS